MTQTSVHLEDVTRAARQGLVLAATVTLLTVLALVVAGSPLPLALLAGAALLALGTASGGFGLVARIALPGPRQRRRAATSESSAVAPLRVPQTR